jgi:hypothetical protein
MMEIADEIAGGSDPLAWLLASLMSRKWLDTRSVIPAKAGIQLALLWIPAFAGKTIVGRECRTVSPI